MKCVAVEIFNQTHCRLHPNLRRTLQQMLFQSSSALTNQSGPALPIIPPSPQLQTASQSPGSTVTSKSAAIALRDVNVSAWSLSVQLWDVEKLRFHVTGNAVFTWDESNWLFEVQLSTPRKLLWLDKSYGISWWDPLMTWSDVIPHLHQMPLFWITVRFHFAEKRQTGAQMSLIPH